MIDQTSVLLVDDNQDLLSTLSLILKRSGFNVDTAENGCSAVDKFRMRHFDVALMDIIMPQMNGVEAFKQIKEIDPETKVILMTAYYEEELINTALIEGVHSAIYKPIDIAHVMDVIKEVAS